MVSHTIDPDAGLWPVWQLTLQVNARIATASTTR